MRVSILTSSRADYGIYFPLLKRLKDDAYFDLNIIAFGTHTSKKHGYSIDNILADEFDINYQIKTVLGDSPKEIAKSMALTIKEFSEIWEKEKEKTDLIICLGDRYEMFAAVSASIPFNITIAHIHGGETTLGAIDNKFRHALTLIAKYHFTSTAIHAEKVKELLSNENNIYNVGALSLDNLESVKILSIKDFKLKFNIDLSLPTILVTFHPETVSFEKNEAYVKILSSIFREITNFQFVITMPNADTMGNVIRDEFLNLADKFNHIIAVENFGLQGYFSAMKHSQFLLGNTSSGIIEAASFNKYVINLGNRQKGRTGGRNIINIEIEKEAILKAINKIAPLGEFLGRNIYKGEQSASQQIIEILKMI
jgi:GDP/UDP-N,N'-diacetylbacillosamine 2-epimerase (hydrolysing)